MLRRVSTRPDRLREAFAALDRGDSAAFRKLFAADAQWLGVSGSGFDGETPT
jgi:ketosteroid isomerase-like protein